MKFAVSANVKGGLGNQLFQIFNAISYSIKHKVGIIFEYKKETTAGITRPTYWDNFLTNLKPYTTTNRLRYNIIRERRYQYREIPSVNINVMFDGYFQSWKYFADYYEKICSVIDIHKYKSESLVKYSDYFSNPNTISMHFRLGDYKYKQDYHPVLDINYYRKSLQYILNSVERNQDTNWDVLYFCESDDIDIVRKIIDELDEEFTNVNFIKTDLKIEDWQQMILMSLCKHHIIANSTFSYWGALFSYSTNEQIKGNKKNMVSIEYNTKKDVTHIMEKIVCYPKKWFGHLMKNHEITDLCPVFWKEIDNTDSV